MARPSALLLPNMQLQSTEVIVGNMYLLLTVCRGYAYSLSHCKSGTFLWEVQRMHLTYPQSFHVNHRPPSASTTLLTANTDDEPLCLRILPIFCSSEPWAFRGLSFTKAISMMFRGCSHSPIQRSPDFG